MTVFNATSEAFATPAPNLDEAGLELHLAGDLRFEEQFITAPSMNQPELDGLGPVFNADACISCHTKDGRGRPVTDAGEPTDQIFLRLSLADITGPNGGPAPVPGFGTQLQTDAVYGVVPEAVLQIDYTPIQGTYGDGTAYELRDPTYTIAMPYTVLPSDVLTSPRVAPPVHGTGLLEAVPESRLEAMADPQDLDGDGISGRVNRVWNPERGRTEVGRLGWKANNPTARQQAAGAYVDDMGITNPARPTESSAGQTQYDGLDDEPEIPEATLHEAAFYVQTLGVPARRDVNDPQVETGEALFNAPVAEGGAGCAGCHVTMHQTYAVDALPEGLAEVTAGQTIHPYTDLLLHDMGSGLADGRPDFEASGREWRTPPLWGIGLTEVVNGHSHFLHDGRARSLAEAILWHGGEAEAAKEAFRTMPAEDRDALIAFLRSL